MELALSQAPICRYLLILRLPDDLNYSVIPGVNSKSSPDYNIVCHSQAGVRGTALPGWRGEDVRFYGRSSRSLADPPTTSISQRRQNDVPEQAAQFERFDSLLTQHQRQLAAVVDVVRQDAP